MGDIKHYIDGVDHGLPRGWQDLEITADWKNEKEDQNINVGNLSFVLGAKRHIENRLASALTGGRSMFEGEPYKIVIGDQDDPDFVFNGYLDFASEVKYLQHDEVEEIEVSLKKEQGTDWLNDVADSFTFRYLNDQGFIQNSDNVKVPYIINYVPDGLALITLSISAYMMTKEIVENVQKLAETIADATDASTPVIGASVGAGAGVVTAWDFGNFVLVAIKVIARVAYIIALTIAVIKLIEEIFEQLFPRKRYHIGMSIHTLFLRGCEYLDLEFESDLLSASNVKNWVIIPSKDKKGVTGNIGSQTGLPVGRDPIDSFGDLIRVMKQFFNADFRITNGVFRFERLDYWEETSTFVIEDFFSLQDRLLSSFKPNTQDFVSNYNITYDYDRQDQNTLDDVEGQVFQAIQAPSFVQNPKLLNVKNLSQVAIPFSIGKRKEGLTQLEKIGKELGKVADKLTGVFGNGTNFENQIESRIGSMLLSSHFLTIPRIVQMAGSGIASDQRVLLSAKMLWEKYHFINSFVPINGKHNQFIEFKDKEIPMGGKGFRSILNNNFVTDKEGNTVRIDKIAWVPERGVAKLDYSVKKIYDKNLKITIV